MKPKHAFLKSVCMMIICVLCVLVPSPVTTNMSAGGGTPVSKHIDANQIRFNADKRQYADRNYHYKEREQFFMAVQPQNIDICFLGDSITQRFPWQDYYREYIVANRGIGSDTTEGILSRLDSVIALNPKVVFLLAGINDLARERTPEEIGQTYRQILERLQSKLPGTMLVAISILPVTEKEGIPTEKILETNLLISKICRETEVLYVDMFSELADKQQYLDLNYALDSVHLNIKGFQEYCSVLNSLGVIETCTDREG